MLQIVAGSVLDGGANADRDDRDDPDAVETQLRGALRDALATVPRPLDPHEPPATHGANSPAWPVLLQLSALQLELPTELGGLNLGVHSAAIVLEELGRAALGSPYAAATLALHALRAEERVTGSDRPPALVDEPRVAALTHGTPIAVLADDSRVVAPADIARRGAC